MYWCIRRCSGVGVLRPAVLYGTAHMTTTRATCFEPAICTCLAICYAVTPQLHPYTTITLTLAPQVIQELHVKNRCAWLNHSANPRAFVDLVGRHPGRIKLWFSGHFHLSQNYPDSISTVGSTAFVQVRDGDGCENRGGYGCEGCWSCFFMCSCDAKPQVHGTARTCLVGMEATKRCAPVAPLDLMFMRCYTRKLIARGMRPLRPCDRACHTCNGEPVRRSA